MILAPHVRGRNSAPVATSLRAPTRVGARKTPRMCGVILIEGKIFLPLRAGKCPRMGGTVASRLRSIPLILQTHEEDKRCLVRLPAVRTQTGGHARPSIAAPGIS